MKKLLLKIARLPFFGKLIGWCVAHLAHVLPLRIVQEDEHCIVFHHPAPSYELHLLAMLKTQLQDISCVSASQLRQILSAARASIEKLELSAPHIMLWTNGGRFQEVRQLHFHIFPSELNREDGLRDVHTLNHSGIAIRECARSSSASPDLLILRAGPDELIRILPWLKKEYRLEARGYSMFWDLSPQAERSDRIYIRLG